MKKFSAAVVAAAAMSVSSIVTPAQAYEAGFAGAELNPGAAIGNATAAAPPPGVYMFDQFSTYQSKIVGPGAPSVGGQPTDVKVDGASVGLIWVPGWQFLGATYDAVLVNFANNSSSGAPINVQKTGFHNTYFVPLELSWKLSDSGFYVKTGLGISGPDGSISGANGLANVGNPWWTFQPELLISYLKDGWNLTAFLATELNTRNTVTGYQTGDVMHAEFAATKQIGKWTIGPLAYYVGQISDDKSSAFYNQAINVNRYNVWSVGGLVGYDFGVASLKVWGFQEISANASGGTPIERASITQGFKVFAALSYRLWAPEEPERPQATQFFKKSH